MSRQAISQKPRAPSRLWILDPWRDLAFFVLAPLWILPLVWWAQGNFGIASFGAIALALGGVGHHLPGFIRAYTDPLLFRRYRTRFILAPLFLLATFAAFSLLELHGLQVIIVLWGAWHGAMQVNGFLRIYDAKAGSFSAATARLDWAMCLAWFGAGLLHSSSRVTAIFMYFYGAGGPPVAPEYFGAFRLAWDVLTAGVTIAFVINAWRQARAGTPASPVKFLLMASTFAFWWFAMVRVYDPILGLLLFEVFHDIQYNTLVWVYNRGRVDQRMTASRVEAFLFRPGAFRVGLYAALVLGYGVLGVLTDYSTALVPGILRATAGSVNFWTGLFTVSAFLHFYFDGFIWQVRERELRQGLGIGERKDGRAPSPPVPSRAASAWRPPAGWKWAFFVVPAVALAALEMRNRPMPLLGQYRNIVGILPDSWSLHYLIAGLERSGRDYGRAAEHYERALAINPDFQPAHAELGDIYFHAGRADMALPHYARAAELDSLDYTARDHLATVLLMSNRVAEALPHLLFAVKHAPGDTNLIYLTGAALMHERRPAEAAAYLYRTLELDPRQPRAWNYLGQIAQMRGDRHAAAVYFRKAAELDPQYAEARLIAEAMLPK
jgi:Flp pilus assembly protein TadD